MLSWNSFQYRFLRRILPDACMSMMFPTIYGMGIEGLGDDTKLGGSGMVMAIAGASVLTQIMGILSDKFGNIAVAYIVPAVAFAVIAYYAMVVCGKCVKKHASA